MGRVIESREASLYHLALHQKLHQASVYQLFPQAGDDPDVDAPVNACIERDAGDTFSVLMEELGSNRREFARKIREYDQNLLDAELEWRHAELAPQRCKKWGCWHKSGDTQRTLSRLFLGLALNDLFNIICRLLILLTVYRVPAVCRDLVRVTGFTRSRVCCSNVCFKPGG